MSGGWLIFWPIWLKQPAISGETVQACKLRPGSMIKLVAFGRIELLRTFGSTQFAH
jgi:hypothetical protein